MKQLQLQSTFCQVFHVLNCCIITLVALCINVVNTDFIDLMYPQIFEMNLCLIFYHAYSSTIITMTTIKIVNDLLFVFHDLLNAIGHNVFLLMCASILQVKQVKIELVENKKL